MSKHLMRDISALERKLLEMSSRVEHMVRTACQCFVTRDLSPVAEVVATEREIDGEEVAIEEECLKILALHQPVASDLRLVATMMKINSELERIADLAVNICERTRPVSERPELRMPEAMGRMSDAAVNMLRSAMDSFVRQDVSVARQIMASDDAIDALNREVIEDLEEVMFENQSVLKAAVHCFSASRHIERIADHATNIAEDILYLVEGEIVRHQHEAST